MFATTKKSFSARLAFGFACLSLIGLALAPIGYRLAWWDYPVAIKFVSGGAVILAALGVLVGLFALLSTRSGTLYTGGKKAAFAVLLCGAVTGWMGYQAYLGKTLDYHDVTTDVDNPPSLAMFADAEGRQNSVEYASELAARQANDYPQLAPLQLTASVASTQNVVVNLVQDNGWELHSSDPVSGVVLATDTTMLYGFKDDIAIRLAALAGGKVQVDMRSNSRVGVSDLGKNAARIEAFLQQLKAQVSGAADR